MSLAPDQAAGAEAQGAGERLGVLALDVGDARIGLAVGRLGSGFAFGRGALERVGTRRDVPAVLAVAEREGAGVIVVGLPLLLDGSESAQTGRVRTFAAALAEAAEAADMSVVLEDERLTTRIAQRQVGGSALPRSRRQEKGRLDEAAAVLILESYLRRSLAGATEPPGEPG